MIMLTGSTSTSRSLQTDSIEAARRGTYVRGRAFDRADDSGHSPERSRAGCSVLAKAASLFANSTSAWTSASSASSARSGSRGPLFYRLIVQAVVADPNPAVTRHRRGALTHCTVAGCARKAGTSVPGVASNCHAQADPHLGSAYRGTRGRRDRTGHLLHFVPCCGDAPARSFARSVHDGCEDQDHQQPCAPAGRRVHGSSWVRAAGSVRGVLDGRLPGDRRESERIHGDVRRCCMLRRPDNDQPPHHWSGERAARGHPAVRNVRSCKHLAMVAPALPLPIVARPTRLGRPRSTVRTLQTPVRVLAVRGGKSSGCSPPIRRTRRFGSGRRDGQLRAAARPHHR